MGSVVFALSCATASFHTYKSIQDASEQLWQSISGQAILIGGLMCYIMGLGK